VEQVLEYPQRQSIYNESLEDFSQNESVSDKPKKIVSAEVKKKMYAKKTPSVKKGGYMTIDINT
jgi:hypothetical protein